MKIGKSSRFGVYLILISGIISIFILPGILIQHAPQISWWPSFIGKGEVGDAINGIAGPFIATAGVLITFLAFYVQFQANKLQINNFKDTTKQFEEQLKLQRQQANKQQEMHNVERFESRFYELLKLHQENTSEISIEIPNSSQSIRGREAFAHMYDEFKLCYRLIFYFIKNNEKIESELEAETKEILNQVEGSYKPEFEIDNIEKITIISYTIFLLGASFKNWGIIYSALQKHVNKKFIFFLLNWINTFQKDYKTKLINQNELEEYITKITDDNLIKRHITPYIPLLGHISRLGHYYRHLYQLMTFLDKYNEKTIPYKEKYIYSKIIRSQLSTYEQVLLYYNCLSPGGSKWIDEGLMERYRPIKNIPPPLTDFAYKPDDKLKDIIERLKGQGISFFEWDEP